MQCLHCRELQSAAVYTLVAFGSLVSSTTPPLVAFTRAEQTNRASSGAVDLDLVFDSENLKCVAKIDRQSLSVENKVG